MDASSLKARLDRHTFLPFRMHLADGRHLDIRRHDWAWVIPPHRRVFIARPELGQGEFLPIEEIDVGLIVSIEELPPESSTAAA